VGGEVYFHESYDGNCLVNAMTVGIVKKEKIFRGRATGVGNPVIYVGSKTGRDGIHGATMASEVFGEGGEERRPTVQVGDPFTEKLLLEACLEVFKTDFVVGIQDMGAAGLTSSSVEMAARGNSGIEIDVSLVPRREEGMGPYEVMLSESQERMLMVVKKGTEGSAMEIFHKWDLEARLIGRVTDTGTIRVMEGKELSAEIPIAALTEGVPVYKRPIKRPSWQDDITRLDISNIPEPSDYNEVLIKTLSSVDLSSREWVYRQYDHMVRTDTVVPPGSDAAVLSIKGTKKALAMTVDCNSRYCYLDPFVGGAIAVAEAARNVVVCGARPLAITDCLNFGSPERPEVMWQFKEAIDGMSKACTALGTPVVGGNVSFYNETSGNAIYPTPTVGMVGLIDDIEKHIDRWFKDEGDLIALLGENLEELGGSEYLKVIHGIDGGRPPAIDLDKEKNVQGACLEAINAGIIKCAHDVSEGGLAVALAECCFSPRSLKGATVELEFNGMSPAAALFGETQSRIVISFNENDLDKVKSIAGSSRALFSVLGRVGGSKFKINDLIDLSVQKMWEAWKETFYRLQERV
jgi:phosphoribosylformylglycinamidine synthase